MAHLIETYADFRRGDFLVNHWLRSLKENVDLRDVDILVHDYGLTDAQVKQLRELGARVERGVRDGRMSNIHYRDLADFLRKYEYDQVLYSDGGDIIFQSDIRPLFENHKDSYRGVCEDVFTLPMHQWTLGVGDIKGDSYPTIKRLLYKKPMINGGFVLGPARKMVHCWDEYLSLCRDHRRHGTDQIIMSYLMYRDGFVRLPEKYNFVLITTKSRFSITRGRFYDSAGELIPVVHNAGRYDWARSVSRFGYGEDRNKLMSATHYSMSAFYSALNWLTRRIRD
jgi:hypothetical protein